MKQYIGSMGYRQIPVGYSAADVESNRFEMASYMNCGTDDQRSDFFAFNDYSWCDHSSFQISGWDQKVQQYSSYSIPLFLSEYGCITNARNFEEVATLYSSQMTSVYSGGLVYEYSEEGSGYGLVTITSRGVTPKPDFNFLQKQFSQVHTSGDGGYKANGQPSQCPRRSATWEVKDFTGSELPTIPQGAMKYMSKGAGKPPGLSGGSQWAKGTSTGTASAGSGAVSATGAAGEGAAPSTRSSDLTLPLMVCGMTVFLSTFLGAALL
jgi:1,3-beta-glucanosyltransferase GAS5